MRGFLFLSLMLVSVLTSCRYTYTVNNYNCCPVVANSWIDTVGFVGKYPVHAIGTRKDINYIFQQTTITNVKGFRIIEVTGFNYTVEIINPNF